MQKFGTIMPLTGNVDFKGLPASPEEDGWGGLTVASTDGSGIQLQIGDFVKFRNPTPGQNGLPDSPNLIGRICAMSGNLFTANVPSATTVGVAVSVYNIQADQSFQLYSDRPDNMEHTSLP